MANGNWEEFGRLAKLDFVAHGAGVPHPNVDPSHMYANSKNMIEIIITVDIRKKNDEALNVTNNEIQKQVYFCNSATGIRIGAPWTISNEANEYTLMVSDRNATGATGSIRHVYKYISCSEITLQRISEHFSVGINIPGIGEFDTSQNGTTTRNGPKDGSDSPFKSPKSLEISALHSINYGFRDNVSITAGGFNTLYENLEWQSQWYSSDIYKTHYNGVCKRGIVYILPKKDRTGQEKFKKHEISYEPIYNYQVSTGSFEWMTDLTHRQTMPGFDLLGAQPPCAVIGRGNDEFQLNVWYKRQSNVRFNGNFFAEDSVYYYRFHANFEENHSGDEEDGAATLLLYKFSIPGTYSSRPSSWQNVVRDVAVKVTDFYGNEGTIKLGFNDGQNFDVPYQN